MKQTFGKLPSRGGSTTQNPCSMHQIHKLSYPELIKPKGELNFIQEYERESSILSQSKDRSKIKSKLHHLELDDVYSEEMEDSSSDDKYRRAASLLLGQSKSVESKNQNSPEKKTFRTFGIDESKVESDFQTAMFARSRLNSVSQNSKTFNQDADASQLVTPKQRANKSSQFSYDYKRRHPVKHTETEKIMDT